MTRMKPSWSKTNVPWETKVVIWTQMARGKTITDIVQFLELNSDKYKNAPLDRSTISKVEKELSNLPKSQLLRLLQESPELEDFVLEIKPELATIIKDTSSEIVESSSKQRDSDIFNKTDKIINETKFREIIEFLHNTCLRKSQMNRIFEFINFFNLEANKYIDIRLKYSCSQFCAVLQKLFDYIEIYNVEYLWYLRLIQEGKIKDKWHHFDVMPQDESDEEYLYYPDSGIRGIEELYLLLHKPATYLFFDIQFPESGFPESDSSYVDWKQELDKLIADCDSSYSEYRSSIRDILYL